jgi:uncharacterized protein YdgA (DUF945 family)
MKKIIVAVVVVLLLATAPAWMGGIARNRIDHAFGELPKDAPWLKVVENKWTSGWLHSEHSTTFELVLPQQLLAAIPAGRGKPIRVSLRDDMRHGPILGSAGIGLARLDSRLVLSEEISKMLTEVLGPEAAVQVVTKMAFFGGTTTTVSGKGRSIPLNKLTPNAGDGAIAWDDFKLVVGIGPHFDTYDMDGRLPRIEVKDGKAGEQLLVSDITVKGGGKRVVGELYGGDATFGIGKFSFTAGGQPRVQINGMKYQFDSSKKDDFFEYAARFGAGEVQSKDLEAIGIQLKEAHFDLAVHHLHTDTLQKLMADLREANAKVYQGLADSGSAVMKPLQEHGLELIKHDPELVVERIGIATPQGDAWIKGTVKLEGVTDADVSGDYTQLLQKLAADFNIEVAQALADKIPDSEKWVMSGIEQGLLKREGDKLISHIEYRKGALLVNGKAPQNMQLPGMAPAAPPTAPAPPPAAPRK